MKFWIYLTAIGLLSGGLFYIKHRMDEATRLEAENKILTIENKEIKNEAQAFGNRTRTKCDRVERLRHEAAKRAKAESNPVKRFPVCAG